jgi:spore maturation protein A
MVYIWSFMMLFSIAVAVATGNVEAMNAEIFKQATSGASYALGLAGVMALWLGLMKIAEVSNLSALLARTLKPLTKRLFPSIPPDSNAMGSIVLGMAAMALGLGDASTPMAIKALQDMQEYNPHGDTVSNDQAVFIALQVSNLALVTPAVIAARVATGSLNPTEIVGPTILCSLLATILNVFLSRVFEKFKAYRLPPPVMKPQEE